MNQIEQILANSIYESSQFKHDQIQALNEMLDLGINIEQIGIIASPSVSVLSYSILTDYLKDHTITINEYNKYLSIDKDRINDIIINVYLGKMHGLTEEQLNLYTNKSCKNIKQSRLIVEKYKDDIPSDKLNKIITSKCGSDSVEGKMLIQEFLLGNVSLDRFLITCIFSEINDEIVKDIMTGDERLIQLYQSYSTYENNKYFTNKALDVYAYIHLVYELTSDNTAYTNSYLHISHYNEYISGNLRFDSSYSLFYFICKHSTHDGYSNLNLTITKHMVDHDTEESVDFYHINEKGAIESECNYRYSLLEAYLTGKICKYALNTTYYNHTWQEMFSWDEFYAMYEKDRCKSFINAIANDKDTDVVLKYYNYAENFVDLIKLYTTKKDKETEIPYLEENLKDADEQKIKNIIYLKAKLKVTNEDIHYYIENYTGNFTPQIYKVHFSEYMKFTEFVDLSKKFNDVDCAIVYFKFKLQGATKDELQYFIDNSSKLSYNTNTTNTVRLAILRIIIKIGIDNVYSNSIYFNDSDYINYLKNYNYAVTNFKNKPKCIGYYCGNLYKENTDINKNLLSNIEKFTDDSFYDILRRTIQFINFCLKMADISTDYKTLADLYEKIDDNYKLHEFVDKDEKVTKDVIIRFLKNCKVDSSILATVIPVPVDEFIQDTVTDSFNNSKNFKAIPYDENHLFIDIINNPELIGIHVIKFSKLDEETFKYIFEINQEDNLSYSTDIKTKHDVINAINKSIDIISSRSEYSIYIEELQDILKQYN